MKHLRRKHPVVFWIVTHVVVILVIFFILGFISGLQDNNRPIKLDVIARRGNIKTFLDDQRQAIVIEYICNNEAIFRWDIDSNNLFQRVSVIAPKHSFQAQSYVPYKMAEDLIVPFLGGGAGAWTIKDIVTLPKGDWKFSSKARSSITGIASGLSGYYLGYVIASLFWDCGSKEIVNYVDSVERWHDIEKAVFFSRWLEEHERLGSNRHKAHHDYWRDTLIALAKKARVDVRTSFLRSLDSIEMSVLWEWLHWASEESRQSPSSQDATLETRKSKQKPQDPDRLVELLIEANETEQSGRQKEARNKKESTEELFGPDWLKRP